MPTKNSTVQKLKTQPKLTHEELKRVAEKLGAALCDSNETISLLTLLFDHLESVSSDSVAFWSAAYTIKSQLFLVTSAAGDAQEKYQAEAFANRGRLLQWPYERKGNVKAKGSDARAT